MAVFLKGDNDPTQNESFGFKRSMEKIEEWFDE